MKGCNYTLMSSKDECPGGQGLDLLWNEADKIYKISKTKNLKFMINKTTRPRFKMKQLIWSSTTHFLIPVACSPYLFFWPVLLIDFKYWLRNCFCCQITLWFPFSRSWRSCHMPTLCKYWQIQQTALTRTMSQLQSIKKKKIAICLHSCCS